MQSPQSNASSHLPKKPSIKHVNRPNSDTSRYFEQEASLLIPLIAPGQSNNQRREVRHSVTSQPRYSSMLSIMDSEQQRWKAASSFPTNSLSTSPSEAESFTSSLSDIRNSTLGMFDTVQVALVRAERAEKRAKASLMKWRTAVVELDRLRDENLLVRNRYEISEAECTRLKVLLDDVQSSCSTSATDDTRSSIANSSTQRKLLINKLSKAAK
ncbi:hypothetical protein VKS41_000946 [Umbelopsis sp. WA50703]